MQESSKSPRNPAVKAVKSQGNILSNALIFPIHSPFLIALFQRLYNNCQVCRSRRNLFGTSFGLVSNGNRIVPCNFPRLAPDDIKGRQFATENGARDNNAS